MEAAVVCRGTGEEEVRAENGNEQQKKIPEWMGG